MLFQYPETIHLQNTNIDRNIPCEFSGLTVIIRSFKNTVVPQKTVKTAMFTNLFCSTLGKGMRLPHKSQLHNTQMADFLE